MHLLFECRGRVIVTGMGKSGIICRKIAATLSSTGTSAFFLHPAEAIHGDLGAIRDDDVVLALSHSGETDELVRLLESIRRIGARLIALTGYAALDAGQRRRRHARLQHRGRGVPDEPRADRQHHGGAGARRRAGDDAARAQGLPRGAVRRLHPGGKLGKRLMRVESVMHGGDAAPGRRHCRRAMPDVIHEMSSKRLGMTCVVDDGGRLAGIFTDGDLRRLMSRTPDVLALTAGEVMTPRPVTIRRDLLAVEALKIMETHKITSSSSSTPTARSRASCTCTTCGARR